jgi:hypothetical protein
MNYPHNRNNGPEENEPNVKYSDIIGRDLLSKNGPRPSQSDFTPRLMRFDAAAKYVGAKQLLVLLEHCGWITASVRRHRMKLYDRLLLDACCDRLTAGEFPGAAKTATRGNRTR